MRRLSFVLCLLLITGLVSAQDEPTPYEIALERIEEARISHAISLDLSELGLQELPPEIGQLSQLEVLNLYNNTLIALPVEIGQLNNLRSLYIQNNQLKSLPSAIRNLTSLEELLANNNVIESLPAQIGELSSLQNLHLQNNELQQLPPEIGQLYRLHTLIINHNNLQTLPLELGQIPYLQQFYFGGNPLTQIPRTVQWNGGMLIKYLRDEAKYQKSIELARIKTEKQRLLMIGIGGIGLLAAIMLGFRVKQRGGRKVKAKRDATAA